MIPRLLRQVAFMGENSKVIVGNPRDGEDERARNPVSVACAEDVREVGSPTLSYRLLTNYKQS